MRLIALLLCLCLQACGGSPEKITVELNADSICSGTGIKSTCASLLPSDWVIDDRAIAGLSLHSLYAGYAQVWVGGPLGKNGAQKPFNQTAHNSQYVVISMGGNDAYESRNPVVFETELRSMLGHIRSIGKTPVVTGIPKFTTGIFDAAAIERSQVLNAITHRVAAEFGAIDAHWDTVPADTIDGVHRTEAGLRVLVNKLAAVL